MENKAKGGFVNVCKPRQVTEDIPCAYRVGMENNTKGKGIYDDREEKKHKKKNILLVGRGSIARSNCSRVRRAVTVGGGTNRDPLTGQRLSGALGSASWRYTMTSVTHGFRGQIALVHALCTVLTWCAAIFVNTFGLALATAHTGAAGSEGCRADSRHSGS